MFFVFFYALLITLGLSLHARRGILQVAISTLEDIIDAVHHQVEVLQILTLFFHLHVLHLKSSCPISSSNNNNKPKQELPSLEENPWKRKGLWCCVTMHGLVHETEDLMCLESVCSKSQTFIPASTSSNSIVQLAKMGRINKVHPKNSLLFRSRFACDSGPRANTIASLIPLN